ncbi:YbaK/EbsC family protein [Sporolactobacillus sp. THM19-2]|uniref:YbaK/EbsC family protein n=1 Tax=Sporolactobacillus sp. THM19-2 TaxID=2511171 RepID=UPI00101EEA57|nr:YbaK/EbsC family protein [Sporolactobacillus sp. THM19-2]RYL90294.1 hypothetical protein EWH91_10070 [Sporolactobacillus sp. THM19-2]
MRSKSPHRSAHAFRGSNRLILSDVPIGSVRLFAVKHDWPVYMDESLKRFKTIFSACGSSHSAIELTVDKLFHMERGRAGVNVCKDWPEEKKEG